MAGKLLNCSDCLKCVISVILLPVVYRESAYFAVVPGSFLNCCAAVLACCGCICRLLAVPHGYKPGMSCRRCKGFSLLCSNSMLNIA